MCCVTGAWAVTGSGTETDPYVVQDGDTYTIPAQSTVYISFTPTEDGTLNLAQSAWGMFGWMVKGSGDADFGQWTGMKEDWGDSKSTDFPAMKAGETYIIKNNGVTNEIWSIRDMGQVSNPSAWTKVNGNALTGYEGPTAPHDVTIPSEVPTNADGSERKAVTTIADAAFFGISSLRSLVLPEGVTTIGKFAFAECVQLTSVTFPSSLQTIGMGAFHGAGLTALTLPEECGLTEIGDLAFKDCDSLTEITIPGYIETVGMGAFFGCDGIRSIELEEGVVTVGDKAFMWT